MKNKVEYLYAADYPPPQRREVYQRFYGQYKTASGGRKERLKLILLYLIGQWDIAKKFSSIWSIHAIATSVAKGQ